MVRAHQEQFEALLAKTSGLIEKFFVQCFISGLEEVKKKSRHHVSPKHTILSHRVSLATRKTMEAILKKVKDSNESGESIVNSMRIKMNQNSQLPPIKRISAIAMQER